MYEPFKEDSASTRDRIAVNRELMADLKALEQDGLT